MRYYQVAGLFMEIGLLAEVHHRYDEKSLTDTLYFEDLQIYVVICTVGISGQDAGT